MPDIGTKNTSIGYTMTYLYAHPSYEKHSPTSCQIPLKTPKNPHQTPPNVITVPFEQRLHSDRGEVQTGEIKTIGNQGTFSKIQGNGQNDDEYIEETILDNEEVSAYTTRTNNRILNPATFRPPSRRGTPESRFRSSPKSSPEATSTMLTSTP